MENNKKSTIERIQLKDNVGIDLALALVMIMTIRESSNEANKFMSAEDFLPMINIYFREVCIVTKEDLEEIFELYYFKASVGVKIINRINYYRLAIIGDSSLFHR